MLNKLYLQLYFSLHLKWGPTLFLHKCFLSLSSILLSSRLFSLKPNLIAKSSLLLLFINAIDNENAENNNKKSHKSRDAITALLNLYSKKENMTF